MTTAVIIVVGVFFLGMGGYALAAPSALARPFRIVVDTVESRSEVRAVYGGFGVAIAVVLGAAAMDVGDIRTGAVITVAVALAGMALGRLCSRVVDGAAPWYPIWFYFWVETTGAIVLFVAA